VENVRLKESRQVFFVKERGRKEGGLELIGGGGVVSLLDIQSSTREGLSS
jgi:hypothetical protein